MGGDESSTNSRLTESSEENCGEIDGNIGEQIRKLYDCLQELGYLITDLYDMDLKELEGTLINRRKGVANECYMIGMLSRTALVKDVPKTPEEMYPYMFPPKKKYVMPDFLKDDALKTLQERGVNIGNR